MITKIATATEMQNNFGRYMNLIMNGEEVIITKNGKEVGRLVPKNTKNSYLTDALTGVIKGNYDLEGERERGLTEKYEGIN